MSIEAMKMAIEVLSLNQEAHPVTYRNAITALRTAIKQAQPAPVQHCNPAEDGVCEALECCKQPAQPTVPEGWMEFVQRVAKQKPEKPDYWSTCGQCERNSNDAEDLLDAAPEAPAAQPALPFGVGGGLAAIKTLLSRDPCGHATTAIAMIDAMLREHPAAQPAPVQEPVHPDSRRIDWMTNNPLCALDIFGHVKGLDAARWIRQEIDNAIQAQEKYK